MIERRKVDDILESFAEDEMLGASATTSVLRPNSLWPSCCSRIGGHAGFVTLRQTFVHRCQLRLQGWSKQCASSPAAEFLPDYVDSAGVQVLRPIEINFSLGKE
jgi:hypothetical protein